MTNSTERKQQYERFKELFELGRQRYLDAGGDPRRSSGSLHGNDHLTEIERQEFFTLGRQLSGFYVKDQTDIRNMSNLTELQKKI